MFLFFECCCDFCNFTWGFSLKVAFVNDFDEKRNVCVGVFQILFCVFCIFAQGFSWKVLLLCVAILFEKRNGFWLFCFLHFGRVGIVRIKYFSLCFYSCSIGFYWCSIGFYVFLICLYWISWDLSWLPLATGAALANKKRFLLSERLGMENIETSFLQTTSYSLSAQVRSHSRLRGSLAILASSSFSVVFPSCSQFVYGLCLAFETLATLFPVLMTRFAL